MIHIYNSVKFISILVLVMMLAQVGFAQKVTTVYGKVIDAETKELLPFVNIGFKGTNVGASTDMDGYYRIETRFPSDSLFASYLGYNTSTQYVIAEDKQEINFQLSSTSLQLETVEFVAKKKKYNKKNNPAIDLSQKVIENSFKNSTKSLPYFSYDQQEKIRLDINNVTEKFKEAPVIRKFDFMWDYIDTSDVNGRTLLPFFMRENLSKVYYKRDGHTKKERRIATRFTEFEEGIDPQSMNDIIEALYQDIDIYEGQISLLDNQFVSPFHPSGKDFYRYYILDTTVVNNKEAIKLAFIPAVKGNLGFTGDVYISNDGNYTVLKVDMGIIKGINLNFVRDIRIIQEFEEIQDVYVKTKDEVVVDYSLSDNSVGLFGTRTLYFKNYSFDKPEDMSVFGGLEKVITPKEAFHRSDEFWAENRIIPLEEKEVELYEMINRLTTDKYYKRYVFLGKVIATGYVPAGPINVGVLATFVSFNAVEGLNLKIGGETNPDFSKKIQLEGNIGKAFKTDEWKYSAGMTYSFNDLYYMNPRHYIQIYTERNSEFPGQELDFYSPGNFFLSFQRGDATKMLLSETYGIKYRRELNGFSYELGVNRKKRMPYGSLKFGYFEGDNEQFRSDITTSEVGLALRYAPNEQFIQGKDRRTQIFNKYPIIRTNISQGISALDGDFNYTKLRINLFKQFEWTLAGRTNVSIESGKTWGKIPYLLQFIPRGNQTYAYELNSYNLMNFMEFAADQYVSAKVEHYFSGLIMNRIPLIKKLKLREVLTVKGIYGNLSKKNDPSFHPSRIQFPKNEDGVSTTYTFDNRPYLEASLGFTNIFKVLRVDFVYRVNYHEHVNVPSLFGKEGMGVRIKTHVEF